MEAVCDCLDMGDGEDKMYQLSTQKLAAALATKANRMAKGRLPASMEERFVRQALEVPVLSVKREDSSISIAAEDATPGAESKDCTAETSQNPTATTNDATISTVADKSIAADEITGLLRVRTALDFLIVSYTPTSLRTAIQDILKAPTSPVDFAPLDKHLEYVAGLKKQAQALRSLSDNISRKRSADDDEDALDKADAKRKRRRKMRSRRRIRQGACSSLQKPTLPA